MKRLNSTESSAFQELLERLAVALDRHRIPYMVIGGQAVLLYGAARFSQDIDMTLGLEPTEIARLAKSLKDIGCRSLVPDPEAFVSKTCVWPCQDDATGLRLDFIFSFSAYEKDALKRVKRVRIGNADVSFASVEDLIIHKMVAGRPRDIEDVRGILRRKPALDDEYLRRWLAEFQKGLDQPVADRFEALQKDASSQ